VLLTPHVAAFYDIKFLLVIQLMIFWNMKLCVMVGKYNISEEPATISFGLEEVAIRRKCPAFMMEVAGFTKCWY
jgi:hypothetical protein